MRCTGTAPRGSPPEDYLPERLREWWPGAPAADVRWESGSLRSLRPLPGEAVVTFFDAENEQFLGTHLRPAAAVLLVLDWLAFSPARQLAYLRQGTWDAVACSTPYLERMISGEGIPAWVVGAGVDAGQFHPVEVPRDPRLTLGTMHSWIPNKGWHDAVEVAREAARASGSRVRLLSFGAEGSPPNRVHPSLGVDLEHRQRPSAGDLRAIYSSMDAYLCTSASEGYGFPSLEAMACGVPVVTYRNGGHTAYLEEGANGRSVEPGDVRGAAAAAVELAAGGGYREAALRTAAALSWPAAAARLDECLRAAVAARGMR